MTTQDNPNPTSSTSVPERSQSTSVPKKFGWVWKSLVGVLLVIVAFYCLGFFLPETYEAELTVAYDVPPDKVWAALQDPEKIPIAGSRIQNVEMVSQQDDPKKVWIEDMGESQVDVKTIEQTELKHLKRTLDDRVITSMHGVMEFRLERTEPGTQVKATNTITIKLGTWHVPVFRCVMYFSNGARVGLRDYLQRVGEHAESTPKFID
ncbi:MAG: hypothetical protein ACFCD0_09600 [Gemmataceae bacterium]